MSGLCVDFVTADQQKKHDLAAPLEIKSIAGADMDAHFRNAFPNRPAVSQIPMLSCPNALQYPRLGLAVL